MARKMSRKPTTKQRKPKGKVTSFRLETKHLRKLDQIVARQNGPYHRVSRGDVVRMLIDSYKLLPSPKA